MRLLTTLALLLTLVFATSLTQEGAALAEENLLLPEMEDDDYDEVSEDGDDD